MFRNNNMRGRGSHRGNRGMIGSRGQGSMGSIRQPMSFKPFQNFSPQSMKGQKKQNRKEPERPSYNTVFIISGCNYEENEINNFFSKFGTITSFRQQKKDEHKLYTFITYSKASEAAMAIEEMNGQSLSEMKTDRLRCLLAMSKESREQSDRNEEKGRRIFCRIPTDKSAEDIKQEFAEFGEVQHVKLLTNKENGKSRGLCFVTFKRPLCAALALENVPESYKPLFAEQKPKNEMPMKHSGGYDEGNQYYDNYDYGQQDYPMYRRVNNDAELNYNGSYSINSPRQNDLFYNDNFENSIPFNNSQQFSSISDPYQYEIKQTSVKQFQGNNRTDIINNFPNDGKLTLHVRTELGINTNWIEHLFRIVPSFESCAFDSCRGEGTIRYGDPACAAYALDRLNRFEYPPGYHIDVSFYKYEQKASEINRLEASLHELTEQLSKATTGEEKDNIQSILDNVIKATSLLKSKEIDESVNTNNIENLVRVRYCTFLVPETKDLTPEMDCVERLFIVAKPTYFSDSILRNLMCRYGCLIDSFFLPGKNYGFAKYGNIECAKAAMLAINGKEVAGQLMRVVVADPDYALKKRAGTNEADESEPFAKRSKEVSSI